LDRIGFICVLANPEVGHFIAILHQIGMRQSMPFSTQIILSQFLQPTTNGGRGVIYIGLSFAIHEEFISVSGFNSCFLQLAKP
jgi:hypothetical protein